MPVGNPGKIAFRVNQDEIVRGRSLTFRYTRVRIQIENLFPQLDPICLIPRDRDSDLLALQPEFPGWFRDYGFAFRTEITPNIFPNRLSRHAGLNRFFAMAASVLGNL